MWRSKDRWRVDVLHMFKGNGMGRGGEISEM